jgi:hypothetical protein
MVLCRIRGYGCQSLPVVLERRHCLRRQTGSRRGVYQLRWPRTVERACFDHRSSSVSSLLVGQAMGNQLQFLAAAAVEVCTVMDRAMEGTAVQEKSCFGRRGDAFSVGRREPALSGVSYRLSTKKEHAGRKNKIHYNKVGKMRAGTVVIGGDRER